MINKRTVFTYLFLVVAASGLTYLLVKNNPSSKQDATRESSSPTQETTKTPDVIVSKSVSLNLSEQGLEKLPMYVVDRADLEELDISNNKLTGALPSEIGRLKNLRVLKASNNLMTGVPAEVGQLENLEVLDLSYNQLTGLPYELGNLKKLKVLNLAGNDYAEADLDVIKKGLSPDVEIIL